MESERGVEVAREPREREARAYPEREFAPRGDVSPVRAMSERLLRVAEHVEWSLQGKSVSGVVRESGVVEAERGCIPERSVEMAGVR